MNRKPKAGDLTGRRFGNLVARWPVARPPERPPSYGRRWICKCDCGRSTIVRARDLPNGNTTSCGCKLNRPAVTRGGEISDRQHLILRLVRERGAPYPMMELPAALGISQPMAGRNVSKLIRLGLLVRTVAPGPQKGWPPSFLSLAQPAEDRLAA